MNHLFEETLSVLYELREEAECEEDARAVEQINLAISNLESIRDKVQSEEQIKKLCLQAISMATRYLPTVVRIIELIRK